MRRRHSLRSIDHTHSAEERNTGMMSDDELWESVEHLCEVKAEEFRMYGYDNVTAEQIWACVSDSYRHGLPRLNRLVNDIMSLKATNFMNWRMISVYKE